MTRSHKQNGRNHAGLANGTASPEEHLPRYFAKNGYDGNDPKVVKKSGFGKGNWGREMDELEDYSYNPTKARRRSNSISMTAMTKSKYEVAEEQPVFEAQIHGPSLQDRQNEEYDHEKEMEREMEGLSKSTTSDSMESVGEDKE